MKRRKQKRREPPNLPVMRSPHEQRDEVSLRLAELGIDHTTEIVSGCVLVTLTSDGTQWWAMDGPHGLALIPLIDPP